MSDAEPTQPTPTVVGVQAFREPVVTARNLRRALLRGIGAAAAFGGLALVTLSPLGVCLGVYTGLALVAPAWIELWGHQRRRDVRADLRISTLAFVVMASVGFLASIQAAATLELWGRWVAPGGPATWLDAALSFLPATLALATAAAHATFGRLRADEDRTLWPELLVAQGPIVLPYALWLAWVLLDLDLHVLGELTRRPAWGELILATCLVPVAGLLVFIASAMLQRLYELVDQLEERLFPEPS